MSALPYVFRVGPRAGTGERPQAEGWRRATACAMTSKSHSGQRKAPDDLLPESECSRHFQAGGLQAIGRWLRPLGRIPPGIGIMHKGTPKGVPVHNQSLAPAFGVQTL